MHKIYSVFALIFCLVTGFSALAADSSTNPAPIAFKQESLTIKTVAGKTYPFTVEIADTKEKQELGLMHRTKLAEDHGMLFPFEEGRYVEMWMKDTLISLDMVFIDKTGKIANIVPSTKPGSTDIIAARPDARAVLELASGVTAKLGIKAGDQVVSSYFKP